MTHAYALYGQVIVQHCKSPENFHELPQADRVIECVNSLCGDTFKLFLKFEGPVIADASFTGHGCAIAKASISMMTTAIKGKPVAEILELIKMFDEMVRSDSKIPVDFHHLGNLVVFSAIREFPVRYKCVILGWQGLENALKQG